MKRSRSSRYSNRSDYENVEAAHPSSSLPPPVRTDGLQYDVFLSFRGPDTRNGFTGHLYQALQDKGIHTFIDSDELEKGQKVEELFGYIERSKIFVPIFSKGYADSKWCLKEITKMVECKRLIIPVFFNVEPKDVRAQSKQFAPAFRRYRKNDMTNKEEVRKWSDALREAGKISGYNLANTNGHEASLIQLIVKRILTQVRCTTLHVAKHPVGLDPRIAELVKVLEVEAQNDVKMVGIHGMGGIGKTTLAKAVYNQIRSHFNACSFISNVREASKKSSKLVSLQEQLLGDVLKDKNVKVNDIDHGIGMIKERIKSKKVLLVLDDVESESQLSALAGNVDWFCPGSRIIITTRDKQVLRASRVEENDVCELKELDATQSLQLFSWHAFTKEEPLPEFAELSKEVAATAAGLPLALEIFGSVFFKLNTVKEWADMLKILKEAQYKEIHDRLRISFDVLDEIEKKIFLDIACFFIGKDIDQAIFVWEACGFFPDIWVKFLMHKSLVNINEDTRRFEMHDHIRDMGRKIVEDENRSNPGMRSRLWKKDDILNVLQNNKGTENIEAIELSCEPKDSLYVDAESFAGMSQLRMLRLRNVRLQNRYEHFPSTLKLLSWNLKDSCCLPSTLQLDNIVVLDLSSSDIAQVWDDQASGETKVFRQLKVLDLTRCERLVTCPDFTCMPHLEKLDFQFCGLTELNSSIGHLKRLTHLNLRGRSLKELPEEVWQLTSLEVLDLSWCTQITDLTSQLRDSKSSKQPLLHSLKVLNLSCCFNLTICPDFTCMPYIEELDFESCGMLTELNSSIGHLKNLTHLNLSWCTSLKELREEVWQLTSLEVLNLSWCTRCTKIMDLQSQLRDSKSLKQPLLHSLKVLDLCLCSNLTTCPDFSWMPYIEELDFNYCGITELDRSIRHLKRLTHLSLMHCYSLKALPKEVWQLTSLEVLNLSGCDKIKALPPQLMIDSMTLKWPLLGKLKDLHLNCSNLIICPNFTIMPYLELLDFEGCEKLTELNSSIGHLKNLTDLFLGKCKSLKALPESMRHLKQLHRLSLKGCFLLKEIPEWIQSFINLEELEAAKCVSLASLPDALGELRSLRKLDLSWTAIKELPGSIMSLEKLDCLLVTGCKRLKFLPQFPPSLTRLHAAYCYELEVIADVSDAEELQELNLSG